MAKGYWITAYRAVTDKDKAGQIRRAGGAGDRGGRRQISGPGRSGRMSMKPV